MLNAPVTSFCFPTSQSLEDLAQALAEGEHDLGPDVSMVGYALIMFPGNDCPWGRVVTLNNSTIQD